MAVPSIVTRKEFKKKDAPAVNNYTTPTFTSTSASSSLLLVNVQWISDIAQEVSARFSVSSITYGSAALTQANDAVGPAGSSSPDTATFYLKNPSNVTASKSVSINWSGPVYSKVVEIVHLSDVNQTNPVQNGNKFSDADSDSVSSVTKPSIPADSRAFVMHSFQGYDGNPGTITTSGWSSSSGITTSGSLTTDISYVFGNMGFTTATSGFNAVQWAASDGRAASFISVIGN